MKETMPVSDKFSLMFMANGQWDAYRAGEVRGNGFTILPSASMSLNTGFGNLSAQYTRRIQRPSVDYLNPEIYYIDEYRKTQGNPDLRPQHTDHVNLGYTAQVKTAIISLTAAYDHTEDLIAPVYGIDQTLALYQNAGRSEKWSFNVGWYQPLFDNKILLNANVGVSRINIALTPEAKSPYGLGNSGWVATYSLNVNYVPTSDWFVNLSSFYSGKIYDLNTTTTRYPITSLSVEKTFLDGKWKVALGYTDLFKIGSRTSVDYRFSNMNQTAHLNMSDLSRVSLSVTYSFGKMFRMGTVGAAISNDDITTRR